jgi:hypothetical protein
MIHMFNASGRCSEQKKWIRASQGSYSASPSANIIKFYWRSLRRYVIFTILMFRFSGFSGFSCFSFCRIEWRRVSTRGDSFVLRSYSSLTKCSRVYCPRSVLRRLSTGIHTNNPFLIIRRYRSRSIYPSTPLVWTSTKQQKKNCGVLCRPTAQS